MFPHALHARHLHLFLGSVIIQASLSAWFVAFRLQGGITEYHHRAVGTAVLHPGDRWHAVQPLKSGSRWTLGDRKDNGSRNHDLRPKT